ncbi:MAG: hypothetical protein HY735_14460 [Verrucomicrobia bacterium]|nr:hypothetical protein [Verrucomicrobiota bacterium]
MQNESDDKLEKLIHRELAKLPELQAPATLIPRVLQALRYSARKHWWQRSWFHWPFGLRVFSLGLAVALISSIFLGGAVFWNDTVNSISLDGVRESLAPYSVAQDILRTLANAAWLILNAIGRFWLLLSLTITFMAYVSCVGIGTVCFRLAINRR